MSAVDMGRRPLAGVTVLVLADCPGASAATGDLAYGVDWTGGFLRLSGKSPTTGLQLGAAVILPEDAGSSRADLQPR